MSLKIKVYNQKAEEIKDLILDSKVFAQKVNTELVNQAVLTQRANSRQVLAHTKDRSEVSGGGKKPWKQKGTGRARAGSNRSPIWIGGGVTFGPTKDRNFKKRLNQKMKQKAMCMVLSDKLANQSLLVVDKLEFKDYNTKVFNNVLSVLEKKVLKTDRRNILIINSNGRNQLFYSGRNLSGVKIINQENINILDLLSYRYLLLTEEIIKNLEKKYLKA